MLFLAQAIDAPVYVVHCSVARSVELVAEARARGQIAFAETCPQYLLLDESAYDSDDAHRFIQAWRTDYNEVRPHSSLEDMPPSTFAATIQGIEEQSMAS